MSSKSIRWCIFRWWRSQLCVLLAWRFLWLQCASVYLGVCEQSIVTRRFTTVVKHNIVEVRATTRWLRRTETGQHTLTIVFYSVFLWWNTLCLESNANVYLSVAQSSSFCQLYKVLLVAAGERIGSERPCWCSCARQTQSESECALSAAGRLSDTWNKHTETNKEMHYCLTIENMAGSIRVSRVFRMFWFNSKDQPGSSSSHAHTPTVHVVIDLSFILFVCKHRFCLFKKSFSALFSMFLFLASVVLCVFFISGLFWIKCAIWIQSYHYYNLTSATVAPL